MSNEIQPEKLSEDSKTITQHREFIELCACVADVCQYLASGAVDTCTSSQRSAIYAAALERCKSLGTDKTAFDLCVRITKDVEKRIKDAERELREQKRQRSHTLIEGGLQTNGTFREPLTLSDFTESNKPKKQRQKAKAKAKA